MPRKGNMQNEQNRGGIEIRQETPWPPITWRQAVKSKKASTNRTRLKNTAPGEEITPHAVEEFCRSSKAGLPELRY